MRMKNRFHIKGWALNLILIERPRETRKWPIVFPPPPQKKYLYSNYGYPGCQRLFMHSFQFQSSLYSDPCKKYFLATLQLVTSAFNRRICQPEADMQEKTSGTQGNHGGPMALRPPTPPPPTTPPSSLWRFHIGWCLPSTKGNWSKDIFERHMLTGSEAFSLDCAFRRYQMFIVTGLSLRGGGWGFPPATMNMATATFIGKQKKNRTKRNPQVFDSPPFLLWATWNLGDCPVAKCVCSHTDNLPEKTGYNNCLRMQPDHFQLTCIAQELLCWSSLILAFFPKFPLQPPSLSELPMTLHPNGD